MNRSIARPALALLLAGFALAACSSDDGPTGGGTAVPAEPYGSWHATEVGPLIADAGETTLLLSPDGAVTGDGGCNGYFGNATVTGGAISFNGMGSTKMACDPATMEQEDAFFAALNEATGWRREGTALVLTDAKAIALVRFEPLPTDEAALEEGENVDVEPAVAAEAAEAGDADAEAAQAAAATALSEAAVETGPSVDEITIALPAPAPMSSTTASYDCDGRSVEAEYVNAGDVHLALLSIDGQFVVAARVLAASGARYSGGQYVWWSKGDEADLIDFRNGGLDAPVRCEIE